MRKLGTRPAQQKRRPAPPRLAPERRTARSRGRGEAVAEPRIALAAGQHRELVGHGRAAQARFARGPAVDDGVDLCGNQNFTARSC